MANPFYDASQQLQQAVKIINGVVDDLERAMKKYEEEATEPDKGKPPSSQLPA